MTSILEPTLSSLRFIRRITGVYGVHVYVHMLFYKPTLVIHRKSISRFNYIIGSRAQHNYNNLDGKSLLEVSVPI